MFQAEQEEGRIRSYQKGQSLKVQWQAHSWEIGQIKELQRPLVESWWILVVKTGSLMEGCAERQ